MARAAVDGEPLPRDVDPLIGRPSERVVRLVKDLRCTAPIEVAITRGVEGAGPSHQSAGQRRGNGHVGGEIGVVEQPAEGANVIRKPEVVVREDEDPVGSRLSQSLRPRRAGEDR